jgi:hypothetical protein
MPAAQALASTKPATAPKAVWQPGRKEVPRFTWTPLSQARLANLSTHGSQLLSWRGTQHTTEAPANTLTTFLHPSTQRPPNHHHPPPHLDLQVEAARPRPPRPWPALPRCRRPLVGAEAQRLVAVLHHPRTQRLRLQAAQLGQLCKQLAAGGGGGGGKEGVGWVGEWVKWVDGWVSEWRKGGEGIS